MLVLFPWLHPTELEFHGMLERFSPLVETCFEGFWQSAFQLYMCLRCMALGRSVGTSVRNILIFSFVPGIISFLWKLYSLYCDAQAVGVSMLQYLGELNKAFFGTAAPFLTILTKIDRVSYESMGPLAEEWQSQIFQAMGASNKSLQHATFDDSNDLKLSLCVKKLEGNQCLQTLTLGRRHSLEEMLLLCQVFHESQSLATIIIGRVELDHLDRERFFEHMSPLIAEAKAQLQCGCLYGSLSRAEFLHDALQRQVADLGLTSGSGLEKDFGEALALAKGSVQECQDAIKKMAKQKDAI